MEQESTSHLMNVLRQTPRTELDDYCRRYLSGGASFAAYMDERIRVRGMKRAELFQRADLPQKYGYKLLTGESHTTDRDKLLRLFFALGMTLPETRRALELYGLPPLYPRRRRDAVFIIALNQGVDSVDTVNEWLRGEGEAELSRSD